MSDATTRGRLGLIGAGAAGPPVARRLADAGWEVGGVASRRLESARAAVAFLGAGTPTDRNADAAAGADLLLVAVPDRAIAAVAEEVAAAGGPAPGALAIHLSGALTSDALAPLRAAGASVGSLHPLQTFAAPEAACRRLATTPVFYEGDDPARVRAVAGDLGGRPVPIDPGRKVLYHAGAAAACNLMVAMVDLGVSLFAAAGIPREQALPALLPLVEGTVGNLAEVGLPGALTGPVARGDVETLRRHVEAIRREAPELLAAYAAASRHAARVGIAKGTLAAEEAARIRELMESAASTRRSP